MPCRAAPRRYSFSASEASSPQDWRHWNARAGVREVSGDGWSCLSLPAAQLEILSLKICDQDMLHIENKRKRSMLPSIFFH